MNFPLQLLFLALSILGGFGGNANHQLVPAPAAVPASVSEVIPSEAPAKPQAAVDLVRVTRVIDGDTIEIAGGERVRYIGVNAPESVDPRKPVACFGAEASAANKKLLGNQMVRLEKDVSERDRYGRL